MTMLATILSVQRENLMVLDLSTRQKVRVNTRDAFRFRQGDIVHIRYSGAMTMSIPPQISAIAIARIHSHCC